MEIEFVSNTGFYLAHNDKIIGMDIWLTQGPFEGSWFHFPPLRQTKYSLKDCDYIYISHIHPDHCDFKALSDAHPDTVFIVPNYINHLLKRKLNAFGFNNVHSLAPGDEIDLGDGLNIRMFGQFINNLFEDAAFGSLIDSAILIRWDDRVILNCNDNYLTTEVAQDIKNEFENIDLALMPHSASGPYPASFRNLSESEKDDECKRLQRQYIEHFVEMAGTINSKLVVPCAAEYVVVGRLHKKNRNIGLASADEAAEKANKYFSQVDSRSKAIRMDCGTILNIDSGNVSGLEPRQFSEEERDKFAADFKEIPFPYDWENSCNDADEIEKMVASARSHMWQTQGRLNWKEDYNIYLNIDGKANYHMNFSNETITKIPKFELSRIQPFLECYLSQQLLYAILTRKSHWNNAEGGLHIDFFREPNIYIPEVFTLLSFFHTPASAQNGSEHTFRSNLQPVSSINENVD